MTINPSSTTPDITRIFEHALAARREGRLADAEAGYRQLLELDPGHVNALINLGNILNDTGRAQEAEAAHRRAVSMAPNSALAHNNLAAALLHLDRLAEARPLLERAVALDATLADAFANLGLLHAREGNLAESEKAVSRAAALAPEQSRFTFQKAQLFLLQGRYEAGWPLYEARRGDGRYATPVSDTCKPWQGEPLRGRRILLIREQGLGDQLQFLRYVKPVADLGGIVDVWVAPALGPLVETLPFLNRCLTAPPDPSEYDFWAPLPSLPGRFGTRVETIPKTVPYLHADPLRSAEWRKRLRGPSAKAGLVWAGSTTHSENRFRSASLLEMQPLAEVPGWSFYSLQKGEAAEAQLADWPIAALGPLLNDFADTAAAIAALDLVITVDTSVAHLAGALGKPVWLLLDAVPDWRWLLDRTDSPWYPTARLFRQRVRGDWREVMQSVADALKATSPAAMAMQQNG